ncbi:unnamed protein product [Orchesella dallaii]|uniref:FBD domain-containing protein n=1 Tax=Orchesella dallaii TaxID=48710 RepID=A0ABP1RHG9_9HEXA
MDKLLEHKCLEYWTKWTPRKTFQRIQFPNVAIVISSFNENRSGIFVPPFYHFNPTTPTVDYTACLPTISSGNHKGCPFPTKSVNLKFCKDRCLTEGQPVIRIETFFLKTGHYLNSLEICKLTIVPNVLGSILRNSPNLKALTIKYVAVGTRTFSQDEIPIPTLPLEPLSKLRHLKLLNTWSDKSFSQFDGVHNSLLSACTTQLVSLDADELPSVKKQPLTFPKLRYLKGYPKESGSKFFHFWDLPESQYSIFSDIEHLSFLEIDLDLYTNCNLTKMLGFIDRFTKTLCSLYLDFKEHEETGFSSITQEGNSERNTYFRRMKFPNLHKFAFFYPSNAEEWQLLTKFLGMFPKMRTLNLLYNKFRPEGNGSNNVEPEEAIAVETFITEKKQEFLLMCPDLKRISVDFDSESVEPMYKISY